MDEIRTAPTPPAPASPDTGSGETAAPSARPRRLGAHWLDGFGRLAGSLLGLFLLLSAGFGVLLGTQSGLRWGLELAQRLAPETLSVGRAEGRVLGRLRLSELTLNLPTLALKLGTVELDWSPRALLNGNLAVARLAVRDLDLALAPRAEEDDEPLTLPAIRLPFGVEVGELGLERLRIRTLGVEEPRFALESARLVASRLTRGKLDLGRLEARLLAPALRVGLQGRATLTDHYPLALTLDWVLELSPQNQLAGAGQLSGDLRRLTLTQQLHGPIEADLATELREVLAAPSWEGQLTWRRLRWPLSGEPIAESTGGALTSTGGLAGFDYRLSGQVAGPNIPNVGVALAGQGSTAGTRLTSVALDTLEGRLEGTGELNWEPELTWDLSLNATGLNPGVQAAGWPGRLDARLSSRGRLDAAGRPDWTAAIESLRGRLRDYPLAASGQVRMTGDTLLIEGLEASSGPSRLRLAGRVAQRLDLDFSLDSPDLASLWPEARGRLSASGRVAGEREAPRVTLDLSGERLALAAQGAAELRGTAELELTPTGRFALQLTGRDLVAGALHWTGLELRGTGRMADHRLSARLAGEPLGLTLDGAGALSEDGRYRGRVSTLALDSRDWGTWSLQRPLPLAFEGARISVGPACLRQEQGAGGCLGFTQTAAGRWSVDLDLDRLDFALLRDVWPDTLSAEGAGRIKGRFQADGASLSGRATAEIPQGRLTLDLGPNQRETFDLSSLRVQLDAGANGLTARLAVPVAGLGRLDGELGLPGWRLDAPARPTQALRGRLNAEVGDLKPLAGLVPDLSELKGAISANLNLGGTLQRPGVSGRLAIEGVGFQLPLLALGVEDMTIAATAASFERVDIRGAAKIGGGQLSLTGEGRTGGRGPQVRLRVEGEPLKLADTKEYFVRLAPGIDIEADPGGAVVRGEIRVPEARLRPRSLPTGTVSPSSDVVLSSAPRRAPFPVTLDLRLVLGDEVTIDGFGVRGRLSGALSVRQEPGREMLGDGQLQITEGQYRLSGGFGIAAELGAPLTITQGRLIYAKSPIGNPGLLLQAERQGGDTTAGVRVVGTLRTPKMTFFSDSDPGLTQADITKYLMTGIPPSANDRTDQAGLAVGTYIAPKIYMEYENGLGDESNKVKLRYDVSKHIELQTETGESQGADIFFKFEN